VGRVAGETVEEKSEFRIQNLEFRRQKAESSGDGRKEAGSREVGRPKPDSTI
jgi:hypothetical protein